MKKELIIYIIVLFILAIIQHPDLLTSPSERISKLPEAVVYGMGSIHPFIFAFIGYVFVGIVRFIIIKPIKKIVNKKS